MVWLLSDHVLAVDITAIGAADQAQPTDRALDQVRANSRRWACQRRPAGGLGAESEIQIVPFG
jgi:hypothetical protein